MISKTSTGHPPGGNHGVRPNAEHEHEEAHEIMGVGEESETELGAKRRRVEPGAENDPFTGAEWVTESAKAEFDDRMSSMGLDPTQPGWLEYARDFVELERRGPDGEVHGDEVPVGREADVDGQRGEATFDGERGEGEEASNMIRGRVGTGTGFVEPEEGRPVRTRVPPDCPSEREWREHRVTHYPYRSWCPCCRAGRGVAAAHRRRGDSVLNGVKIVGGHRVNVLSVL